MFTYFFSQTKIRKKFLFSTGNDWNGLETIRNKNLLKADFSSFSPKISYLSSNRTTLST